MRKCTSFPSLVVLKHIHMSSMFPFLLLPLRSLFSLSLSLLLPSACFPSMKNGRCVQMDDMTHWSGVFLLLSCCWLSRLTVWQIQFGVLECAEAMSVRPELLVELCANRGSRNLSASHMLQSTHKSGEACYRVWAALFFFFFFFSLPTSASLSLTLFLSFSPLEKTDLF